MSSLDIHRFAIASNFRPAFWIGRNRTPTAIAATILLSVFVTVFARGDEFATDQIQFFESKVRPLLAEHCYECHSVDAEDLHAGLRLDSRAAMLSGGDSGAAIDLANPAGSLLIDAVNFESYEMPPEGKLPAASIEILNRWIQMGAPWPDEPEPTVQQDRPMFDLQQRAQEHWCWQPISAPEPPAVQQTSWPISPIDHFILAKLEAAKLAPASDAPRHFLLRRLYFDLIGLPPTAQQVTDFANDESDSAVATVVDQLLGSEAFGERWGRHWLDLVRYAESRGHEFDEDAENAFQYRDYVINALNADIPYDEFVREHIAGDLIDDPRTNPNTGGNESILGTGFWHLGEWVHSPVDIRKDESDRFDNMIDVMSKTFLGVTVACARCHDHKFDAISTKDYYSLSGFLQSSDFRLVRHQSIEQNRDLADRLAALDSSFRKKIETALGSITAADRSAAEQKILNIVSAARSGESQRLPSSTPAVAIDYSVLDDDEYLQDGVTFGKQPTHAGDFILDAAISPAKLTIANVSAARSDPFWHGLISHNESKTNRRNKLDALPRSGRTLRTPSFIMQDDFVSCLVRGSGHVFAGVDSHRLLAGPLHGELLVKVPAKKKDVLRWVHLNLARYNGHRVHLEFIPDRKATLSIVRVETGRNTTPPAKFSPAVTVAESEINYQDIMSINSIVNEWQVKRRSLADQRVLESSLAMAMLDGTGEDDHVLIRGSSDSPGEVAVRSFLDAVGAIKPLKITAGSGRLELAAAINHPANPLTRRVIVNRIWHHLMGRGIVPTTDDFGVLGQRPSHPELLDHLATDFSASGMSLKRMIRSIVLSRTYQMGSRTSDIAVEQDPKNTLWHFQPPRRLQGEAIRDMLLAISGELDRTMHGPSVPIHLTSFMGGRGRPPRSGPLDGERRRSIYIAVRRNFMSPFMLAFDTPVPFSTMGRRNSSNVPAQALIMLNHPFVTDRCQAIGRRVTELFPTGLDDDIDAVDKVNMQRIDWLVTTILGRPADRDERLQLTEFVRSASTSDELDAWQDIAHILVNTKEFIYLR